VSLIDIRKELESIRASLLTRTIPIRPAWFGGDPERQIREALARNPDAKLLTFPEPDWYKHEH